MTKRSALLLASLLFLATPAAAQDVHLLVIAGVACDSPALITAWRAGFWPQAACSTWPRITSLTWSGASFARSSSALMTVAPSSAAGVLASAPPNLPTAVRAAATMTMSVLVGISFDETGQAFCLT